MTNRKHLRVPELASYIGLSTSTLAKMRLRGDGPPYSKAGRRVIVYDIDHVNEWLARATRRSTNELPGVRP